jgi:hypothetical protein
MSHSPSNQLLLSAPRGICHFDVTPLDEICDMVEAKSACARELLLLE